MSVKAKLRYLFLAVLFTAVFFTACDAPLGMGEPIDWEPPVLTIDPTPNPLIVRKGTTLTGKVTDNVGVERVIFIDTNTGKEIFPVIRDGDNWKIELNFTEAENGRKIVAQICAYDKAGNSGGSAIAVITLYVDIRPPIIKNIDIKRTDSKLAYLYPYADLKKLETLPPREGGDPDGEKKSALYKYQNGWFYVNGIVEDLETKVEVVSLDFYDAEKDINKVLLSLPIDENYTPYFPRWTVKEEDVINAGQREFGGDYKTNYYKNEQRYYYRVVIKAKDKGGNENGFSLGIIEEDEGYVCMWAKSDKPKGVIDPAIGAIVSRNTPLPVDIFDDDSLLWAYTALLTKYQWEGIKPVYPGVFIQGATKEAKLLWLKERLTGSKGDSLALNGAAAETIYNWRYDKHGQTDKDAAVIEQVGGRNIDEKLVYVPTGNAESDYGEYVLFTIVADKKLTPHTGNGPEWTNRNIWACDAKEVQVIDENSPLIVFDTTAGSPEENTFPDPLFAVLPDPEEKFFNIIGYTLRENASGLNKVDTFRMAWIPYNINGGADSHIRQVQNALRSANYPENFNSNDPDLEGIQHWDFVANPQKPGQGEFKDEGDELIDGSIYKKQSFRKRLSVMGDADDLNPEYRNFMFDYRKADKTPGTDGIPDLENETKLFIFYAFDNMGHEVFRQMRLLGFLTLPEVSVYDITNYIPGDDMPDGYPNPSTDEHNNAKTGSPTPLYYQRLNSYNQRNDVYNKLKSEGGKLNSIDLTVPFQIYPRGTILKYWVSAAKKGRIGIETITMKDITFASKIEEQVLVGSGYKTDDKSYSFCEYYPDVTQRTFLFEATDRLGNTAQIQRTIAVTSAARLENITTTSQNGTYGMDKIITLRANFSGQIYVNNGVKPHLNVRYKNAKTGGYVYAAIPCNEMPTFAKPSLYLEFDFKVTENASGALETMYGGIDAANPNTRPLELGQSQIFDFTRKNDAFIPGYVTGSLTMPNWINYKNSLQQNKEIKLDGVRPVITSVSWRGVSGNSPKTPHSSGGYYFKEGESIELTITADKNIRASGNSTIQYRIFTDGSISQGPYNAEFKYQKPGDTRNILVYSLPVNPTSCPFDGRIAAVSLVSEATVIDDFDNKILAANLTMPNNVFIYVKQTKPAAPAATLNNAALSSASIQTEYNAMPTLRIPNSTSSLTANIGNGLVTADWEDVKQYSLNGGLSWTSDAPASPPVTFAATIPVGKHKLQARYIDRAGNEGPVISKDIQVNDTFPRLVSASVEQSNGWYIAGSSLSFTLNFAEAVRVQTQANVTIKIANRASGAPVDNGEGAVTLTAATAVSTEANTTAITFNWNNISNKEMRDGLYIYEVNLTGLRDKFGNSGSSAAGIAMGGNIVISSNGTNCPNLPWTSADASVKVDAIAPSVTARSPGHDAAPAGNGNITQIQLTFREPVMRGNGTITIRPKSGYAIPPVLEDEGYYLGTDGQRYTSAAADRTYISSFYDVYNASNSTNKGYLTQGSSMSNLTLNARTGQSAGPYKKMTQGLVSGFGYEGTYNGNDVGSGRNAPSPINGFLIPDTATKWVLDYQYGITQNVATVNNIRTALTNAKWRWQEIDVVNTSVGAGANANVVTIPLNEPLLKGLDWEVYYPAGAFTDLAGNSAAASGVTNAADPTAWTNNTYFFTSPGVQPPVIRVNRRSYDARTANWSTSGGGTYSAPTPALETNWNTNTFAVSDSNGWGIDNFKHIHYRVESESSAVKQYTSSTTTVSAQSFQGASGNNGGFTGNWSGAAGNSTWTATADTRGSWAANNLIRRAGSGLEYTVTTKNGTPEVRRSQNNLRMFKSYNRDLTAAQLGFPTGTASVTLANAPLSSDAATMGQGFLSFDSLEASKSYIVGSATCNGQTAKGVEGVFRTVIMVNQDNSKGNEKLAVEGSNIKNGMPSVAGFPVRDAEETGDARFIKLFYNQTAGRQFYWISTEIVCEWYFLSWAAGSGGTHQSTGEVNNYMMVGYGDLTYGYNISWY